MDNTAVALLWSSIAQMEPRQVVGRLAHLVTDERVQPGYVGRNYTASGLLLLAMNPAGDATGDCNEFVYQAIAALDGSTEAFDVLNSVLADLMQTWPIYLNVIAPLVEQCGITREDVALLNILPLRADKENRARLYDVAWHNVTEQQVTALSPRRIVCLGKEAFDFVSPLHKGTRLSCIRRTQGDKPHLRGYENTREDIASLGRLLNSRGTLSVEG
jgi:hypothetical protein